MFMERGKKMAFNAILITDTHYFETKLGGEGEAYERRSFTDQKCVAETGAILKVAFKQIAEDKSVDTILIPGDLVYRGEYESHVTFREMLRDLKAQGKKIYITIARHDYATAEPDYVSQPKGFIGNEEVDVEGMPREKLREFYYEFGYEQAISEHEKTISYVAQLNDNIRLLAINCDGDFHSFKGLYDDQMEWIKEQVEDAHKAGCYIFAIMHYPLIPGSPILQLIDDAKITDWQKRADELADLGLDFILTGHMHMQSCNTHVSPAGNKITDICTGSIVGCPSAYRKLTFNDNGTVNVRSYKIDDFEWDKGDMDADEYFKWRFDRKIVTAIDGMAYNFDDFAGYFGGAEKLGKLKPAITIVGKILQKLTIGGVGRMFCFKVDKSIKKVLLKDLSVELVRNVFCGDQPYTEGTPVYEAVVKLFKRLNPILKKVEKKVGEKNPLFSDITGLFLSLIGKEEKLDNNCDLQLNYNYEVKE